MTSNDMVSNDMTRALGRHRWSTVALGLALCMMATTAAEACPYSIRESAFISTDGPTTFRLCLLTTSDSPERGRLNEAVDVAATTWLGDSNVVAEIVDVDRDVRHELRGAIPGRLLDVSATPAAVLISPRNEAIELELPDGPLAESVMDVVRLAIESPVRRRLAEKWATAWCVLLVVTGNDDAQNKAALDAANDAAARIHGTLTEMDKLVEHAPEVIAIPSDSADERLALWSLGLVDGDDQTASTSAKVAMLVGRGELRGPVLVGDEITSEKVYESLEMLGRNCSCTTDFSWLSGPVLPLEWTDEMQAAVVAQLDFDPNDPTAAGAIRDVMSGLDQALGYHEFTSGYREMKTPDADETETTESELPGDSVVDDPASDSVAGGEQPDLIAHRNGTTGYREAAFDVSDDAMPQKNANAAGLALNSGPSAGVMLTSLAVVVLLLGVGTAIVWGRRGH